MRETLNDIGKIVVLIALMLASIFASVSILLKEYDAATAWYLAAIFFLLYDRLSTQ